MGIRHEYGNNGIDSVKYCCELEQWLAMSFILAIQTVWQSTGKRYMCGDIWCAREVKVEGGRSCCSRVDIKVQADISAP
jgi:hypothetical protein